MGIKSVVRRRLENHRIKNAHKRQLDTIRQHIAASKENIAPLSAAQDEEAKAYWQRFGFDIKTDWHRFFYAMTGRWTPQYITNSVFYRYIQDSLNDRRITSAWSDKAYLDRFVNAARTPRCVVRNTSGRLSNESFELISPEEAESIMNRYDALVVKPALFTSKGKGVRLIKKPYDFKAVDREYKSNYVIQLPITQHKDMAQLNSSSVNTIRVNSVLLDGKAEIMSCFVKVGKQGEFADNSGHERYFIGIDPQTGKYMDYCIDHDLNKYTSIPSGFNFAGQPVPNFDQLKETVAKAHACIPHFAFAFWDVCVEADGNATIIEANLDTPNIIVAQATGFPFLGEQTEQIMRYYQTHRK